MTNQRRGHQDGGRKHGWKRGWNFERKNERKSGRKKAFAVAVMAALCLALTACPGKKDGGKSDPTPAVQPSPSASGSATSSASPSQSGERASAQSPSATEQTGAGQSESVDSKTPVAPLKLTEIVPEGTFESPVGMAIQNALPGKAFVVEQRGRIATFNWKAPDNPPEVALDITDRVYSDGNEQGLLGLVFEKERPGVAYVNYTTKTHTRISRFTMADPEHPEKLDPASEVVLLEFKQPYTNHNGGQLAFGPDGYLYIATGDGGSRGDPHGNGQNTNSLLGKILRIDVRGGVSGVKKATGKEYFIPGDNPFAKGGGAPEVYAYGLRNPWRFSFDEQTGQLWAGDVGQDKLEEIDLIVKGGNYGWNAREGNRCYEPKEGCPTEKMIEPVYVYGRDLGVSITGGYVYRGNRIPSLVGRYVYADYATGTIWALRYDRRSGKADNETLLQSSEQITSFATDADGELYIVAQDGGMLRIEAE